LGDLLELFFDLADLDFVGMSKSERIGMPVRGAFGKPD
jgi:hypothetical protein